MCDGGCVIDGVGEKVATFVGEETTVKDELNGEWEVKDEKEKTKKHTKNRLDQFHV